MTARIRRFRENVRFAAGLAGLGYETVVDHSDRPVLLAVFAAMVGIDVLAAGLMPRGGER